MTAVNAHGARIEASQPRVSAARAHRNMSASLPLSSGASTSVSAIASVFSPSSCTEMRAKVCVLVPWS